jgi:hypothetical protein
MSRKHAIACSASPTVAAAGPTASINGDALNRARHAYVTFCMLLARTE